MNHVQAVRLSSSTTIALFLAAETSPHDLAQLETLKSDEYPGDKRSQEPDLEASCKIITQSMATQYSDNGSLCV